MTSYIDLLWYQAMCTAQCCLICGSVSIAVTVPRLANTQVALWVVAVAAQSVQHSVASWLSMTAHSPCCHKAAASTVLAGCRNG